MALGHVEAISKIDLKERLHKYSADRGKTHVSLSIGWANNKLNSVNISFQKDTNYQLTVTLNRWISDDWYKSVQFSSNFYELNEREMNKRIQFVKKELEKMVASFASDESIKLKKELYEKRKEIDKQLESL